jgi:hypothetical protein
MDLAAAAAAALATERSERRVLTAADKKRYRYFQMSLMFCVAPDRSLSDRRSICCTSCWCCSGKREVSKPSASAIQNGAAARVHLQLLLLHSVHAALSHPDTRRHSFTRALCRIKN